MSSWSGSANLPRIAACSKDSVVYVWPRNVRWADLRTQGCHWESERSISRSGWFAVHPHNPAKRGWDSWDLSRWCSSHMNWAVEIQWFFALVSLPTINIYQQLNSGLDLDVQSILKLHSMDSWYKKLHSSSSGSTESQLFKECCGWVRMGRTKHSAPTLSIQYYH